MFHILGFYKFKKIININNNKINLQKYFLKNSIRGTLIVSNEGINGTISAKKKILDLAINKIKKTFKINNFDSKNLSMCEYQPFHRSKVKIKNEVVPLGIKVNKSKLKNYIDPSKWNKFINHNKTLLIDVRKPFEYDVGTFKNAINPQITNFREFPSFLKKLKKENNIAMFCTGGIRCEKASVYLKHKGFKNVYQLKGGILNYLKNIEKKDSLWRGECYVPRPKLPCECYDIVGNAAENGIETGFPDGQYVEYTGAWFNQCQAGGTGVNCTSNTVMEASNADQCSRECNTKCVIEGWSLKSDAWERLLTEQQITGCSSTGFGGCGNKTLINPTGHSLIKKRLLEEGALLGGEMSGHIFFNDRWPGFDDAIYAGARMLEIVSEADNSDLLDNLPKSCSTPEINISVGDKEKFNVVEEFKKRMDFKEAKIIDIDGIRVEFKSGWGLLRPSNTSPVLVLRFEATSNGEIEVIKEKFKKILYSINPNLGEF